MEIHTLHQHVGGQHEVTRAAVDHGSVVADAHADTGSRRIDHHADRLDEFPFVHRSSPYDERFLTDATVQTVCLPYNAASSHRQVREHPAALRCLISVDHTHIPLAAPADERNRNTMQ